MSGSAKRLAIERRHQRSLNSEEKIQFVYGFDDGIVGSTDDSRVVYSIPACISLLKRREKLSYIDAVNFLYETIASLSEPDPRGPIFINPLEDTELYD